MKMETLTLISLCDRGGEEWCSWWTARQMDEKMESSLAWGRGELASCLRYSSSCRVPSYSRTVFMLLLVIVL